MKNISKVKQKGVSIIIPTYNDQEIIERTLTNVVKKTKIHKEIIIVDDSNDRTGEIVKKLAYKHREIVYIKNKPTNKGFVNSIKLGVKKAKKETIVFVMGDMCDDPKTVDRMYKKINQGWDVVCGSRYMKGGKRIGGPEALGLLSEYLCKLSYFLIGFPTHDVTNSFKMYRKDVLSKLMFNSKAETAVSMELLCQAYYKGAKITEIPTTWRGRKETNFKLYQRGPKYFRIFWWGIKNRIRKILNMPLTKFYRY